MPFVPTNLTPGAVVSWAPIATNNAAFRTWCNAIPVGDVSGGAIRREHLARPVLQGFPIGGSVSTLQQALQVDYGLGQVAAELSAEWGARRQRLAFNPFQLNGQTEYWYTPIALRVRLFQTSDIEVHCTYEYQTKMELPASGGPRYPTGAGAGDRGGNFCVHSRTFSTGAEVPFLEGQDFVYPDQNNTATYDGGKSHEVGMCHLVDSFAAGVYDLMMVYHRGQAPAKLYQIDVSRAMMTIEVL